jgi:uncharacterized cupredoxin-like copper-binding protein
VNSAKFKSLFLSCLLLLVWCTLVASCGGSGTESNQKEANTLEETTSGGTTAAGTTSAQSTQESTTALLDTIQVNETEMSLDPTNITLDRPGTYGFRAVNVGNDVHALRIEGNGIEEKQTRELIPGDRNVLIVTLSRPGTYEIDCPVDNHEELGMKGTVTVRGGD